MRGVSGLGVVITGAARGIGLAIAARFLEEGARLFLCDRDGDALGAAVRPMSGDLLLGHAVCDVAVEDEAGRTIAEAREALGGIDVLVNNAGIAFSTPALDTPLEEWDETLRVNLRGPFIFSQLVGREMVAAGTRGAIVNIASTNGLVSEVGYAAYNASKAGLVLLSQTLAVELAPSGIRVNAVCPGYIVTPLSASIDDADFVARYIRDHIPLGTTGTPADVAAACAFLASSDSAFITGTAVVVDGGQLAFSGNR